MNITGRKNIFFAVSAVLLIASAICIAMYGFELGIDFKGGALWQFRAHGADGRAASIEEVREAFSTELGIPGVIVSTISSGTFLVRVPAGGEGGTNVTDETSHQTNLLKLQEVFPDFEELSFQSIGPSIGRELRTRSIWAIILVLIGISLYIAFAFRKASRPVASWKYGVVTLVTLFHDVIVPAGFLALMGHIAGVEIDSNFIVALLVVMGFSVHDTIVVFDRIRENLIHERGRFNFADVINKSVTQTMSRSVNTSLTLIIVLVALYLVGPHSLAYFLLTMLIGVTLGTYSSIFVASPALLVMHRESNSRG